MIVVMILVIFIVIINDIIILVINNIGIIIIISFYDLSHCIHQSHSSVYLTPEWSLLRITLSVYCKKKKMLGMTSQARYELTPTFWYRIKAILVVISDSVYYVFLNAIFFFLMRCATFCLFKTCNLKYSFVTSKQIWLIFLLVRIVYCITHRGSLDVFMECDVYPVGACGLYYRL